MRTKYKLTAIFLRRIIGPVWQGSVPTQWDSGRHFGCWRLPWVVPFPISSSIFLVPPEGSGNKTSSLRRPLFHLDPSVNAPAAFSILTAGSNINVICPHNTCQTAAPRPADIYRPILSPRRLYPPISGDYLRQPFSPCFLQTMYRFLLRLSGPPSSKTGKEGGAVSGDHRGSVGSSARIGSGHRYSGSSVGCERASPTSTGASGRVREA